VQIKQYLASNNINTSHFLGAGWNIAGKNLKRNKIALEEVFITNSTYQSYKLKRRLFSEGYKQAKCEQCGWKKVSTDGRIPLELHHINGNRQDNRLANLQILCPNCHSLEPTHRGKNIKKV